MTLRSRLNRLERAAAEAGISDNYCAICGYPERRVERVILDHANPDPESLARCIGCGRQVDDDGRPLNDQWAKFLVLDKRRYKEVRG